jgi:CubicO group peptidase (beta-lactamase class C family)
MRTASADAALTSTILVLALTFVLVSSPRATPAEENSPSPLDPKLRIELLARANALPRMRSLLVSIDDELVEEHYYHGAAAHRVANVKSVSKSIISILVGIAIDQGYVSGIDQVIADYFPDYFARDIDSAKIKITVQDLLTMQAGLETTSNRNYGRWVQDPNWVRHVLSRPMVDRPGGRRIYSTGNTHLLSAIITGATGMSTLEFGRRYLAQPLGFTLPAWHQDPQGIYFGGNEMLMTSRAMISIGQLYLSSGSSDGRQIVPEDWVRESLIPRSRSERSGREYGYGWWMRQLAGHQTYYAWGYGGQFIFIVPDLKLTVVMTSSPNPGNGRRSHLQSLYNIVENKIIPAI